jgi:hypothetical protein
LSKIAETGSFGRAIEVVFLKIKGSLPILRKFWLYSKPKLIYAGRLDSLHYNFPEKW